MQGAALTFYDEVTSGLDFETRQKLVEKLEEWYRGSSGSPQIQSRKSAPGACDPWQSSSPAPRTISLQMILFEFRKTIGNPYVHIFGVGMPVLMMIVITRVVARFLRFCPPPPLPCRSICGKAPPCCHSQ